MSTNKDDDVQDLRHQRTRANNPPAAMAAAGSIPEAEAKEYRLDPHLPPELRADASGESDDLHALLAEAKQRTLTPSEVDRLDKGLVGSEPWLGWSGKTANETLALDPVALHLHERISGKAIVATAKRERTQRTLFADPEQPYNEAVEFYRHEVGWSNRMILGDCATVMNSLATREGLAGKVQTIYMDPPYGINFSSNFQPFVNRTGVNDTDEDLPRVPEVVKAYRDQWELGVHSYLTYLRNRLTIARELLSETGSIFVQIGEENVHFVRTLMDEVFGRMNFVSQITYRTSTGVAQSKSLTRVSDFIIWYCKDEKKMKFNRLFEDKPVDLRAFRHVELPNGKRRLLTDAERKDHASIPDSARIYRHQPMHSRGAGANEPRTYFGREWTIPSSRHWRFRREGADRLHAVGRIEPGDSALNCVYFHDDFPVKELENSWQDTGPETRKRYAVQTNQLPVQRCILMTSDPGDLVLDPTCGSGTTAVVAERWGRRWITIDISRVAITVARQRLLTTTYDFYETGDGSNVINGSGFVFETVPHLQPRDIANDTGLDPIVERWRPTLDERLTELNERFAEASDSQRRAIVAQQSDPKVIGDRFEHWQVPFESNTDYPDGFAKAVKKYRKVWAERAQEIRARIEGGIATETLVDKPRVKRTVVRVSGPFTVESVNPPDQSIGLGSPIGGAPLGASGKGGLNLQEPMNELAHFDEMTRLLREFGFGSENGGGQEATDSTLSSGSNRVTRSTLKAGGATGPAASHGLSLCRSARGTGL